MAYITPIHLPSGIRNALTLQLIRPEEDVLAVARCNRLEIYTIDVAAQDSENDKVLNLVCSTRIFGRITALNKFRPADSMIDHIFVGTDLCNFFTMHWDDSSQNLVTTDGTEMSLLEVSAVKTEADRCSIDPSNEYMVLEVYEGIITTVPLARRPRKNMVELGHMGKPAWGRVPELNVRSSAFIQRPGKHPPRLALLWIDHEDTAWLKIRELDFSITGHDPSIEYKDLDEKSEREHENEPLDYGASHLIPVQADPYGLIILGETSISYFDDREYCVKYRTALEKATIWSTWTQIDSQRYLLADIYGEVYMLMLIFDKQLRVKEWQLDPQGKTSQATCLVYLDVGLYFIGSHQGDSELAKVRREGLLTIQTLPNIGPILDFTVMDMGNRSDEEHTSEFSTGQSRIVTGSGAWVDGSLRSVRSGVGIQDLGLLDDLEHVTHLFGLKLDPRSQRRADSLLVSFVDETRLYHFDADGDVSELGDDASFGIILDEQTIHARNLLQNRLVQATTSSILLIDLASARSHVITRWSPSMGGKITAISSTVDLTAVSIDGKTLSLFDTNRNLEKVKERCFEGEQISCIHLRQKVCFVASWRNSAVTILDNRNFQPLQKITINELDSVVPRSILMTKVFQKGPETLLISMADGHVVTYDIDASTYKISNRKATILGTRQADLEELPLGNGVSTVFVSSEHPTLIYDEGGKMAFSAINSERVNAVCSFDSSNFPGQPGPGSGLNRCIAIASSKNVTFANIDSERTTQVQPLEIGQTVRRISYCPSQKAFGMGTIKRIVKEVKRKDGVSFEEATESYFRLVDEIVFKELDSYKLHEQEIIEAVMCMKCDDGYGEMADRFIIGTSLLDTSTTEGLKGRVIVFEVTEDRKLRMSTQQSMKASCRCLIDVNGHIAAAFDKNIFILSLEYTTGSTPYLKRRARYPLQTAILDMTVERNEIILADMIKSIHVLEYTEDKQGDRDSLTEVARHFQTLWSTAVGLVAPSTYLVSDGEGNLVVLTRNTEGVTNLDRQMLQPISEFRLGEMVNRIRSIDVKPSPMAFVHPKAFVATVSANFRVHQDMHADYE
jgi:DNA damage-binding protein 1